jgi:Flp pilus assembly protein TadG
MTPQFAARPRGPGQDRGSVTLEIAILFPALLLVIFTAVQGALWYHARSLALAAAQEGVRAARAEHAAPGAGVDAAYGFLDRAAGDSLSDITVTPVAAGPTEIRIRVTGTSLSVLPGLPGFTVAQEAHGTLERFTTPGTP